MQAYEELTTAELADVLSQKFRRYRAHGAKMSDRMFYFEGQDPFEFAEPSSAIASLHSALSDAGQRKLELALLDLLGSRVDLLNDEAVRQLTMTVGNLRHRGLLLRLVRRICLRASTVSAPRELFVTAIMVLKGFGFQSAVYEATRELIGSRDFPTDLLIDAFEILSTDDSIDWHKIFLLIRNRIEADHIADEERVCDRLRFTAKWMTERLGLPRVQQGLNALAEVDANDLDGRLISNRRDVTAALVRAILSHDHRLSFPEPQIELLLENSDELLFTEVV